MSCNSISGLRYSYNYLCSCTYYLIIRALSLPPSNFRFASAARYGLIFPLLFLTNMNGPLSYTYRVLISPTDESSEQRNNKAKPKHSNFPCCEQWLRRCEPEDGKILFSAMPWRGPSLWRGVGPPTLPRFCLFLPIFQKSNQNSKIIQEHH